MKNWYAIEVGEIFVILVACRIEIWCLFHCRLSDVSPSGPFILTLIPVGVQTVEWVCTALSHRKGFYCMDEKWLTVVDSYTVVGAVVVGASWYLYRLARGPEGGSFLVGHVHPSVSERPFSCVDEDKPSPS
jgi:hypothetical protein